MRWTESASVLLAAAALAACTGKAPDAGPSPKPEPVLASGSFTAELNGFTIHYEVHGQGPVLMTVPNSWGLSLQGLRAIFRPLEERLTVVYFDPRGMGGSGPVREDADRGMVAVRADFQALRAHLGLEKVNAIGWSNGAMNLIWLAAENQPSLRSAIFVHGMASFTAEDGRELAEKHPEMARMFARLQEAIARPGLSPDEQTALHRKMWLEEYFPLLCADRERGRELVASLFGGAQLSWPHAAWANRESAGFDAREELSALRLPALVVAGAHDLLPPERVKALADGIPGARFAVFERSGHFAPVEEPEAFAAAVFSFLGVGGEPLPGS